MINLHSAQKLLVKLSTGPNPRTLGAAESLTAGLFSASFCSVPGASKVFKGAVVSYANEVKENLLGVAQENIAKYGVVSSTVAKEMALGALKALNVDIAVSFTGNAGPSAEAGEAPVGRVYMAIAIRNSSGNVPERVLEYQEDFTGSRNAVREECVTFMLDELLRIPF